MIKNDPYVDQIKETIFSVMQHFKNYHWHLSFQSRGREKDKWLSPEVEEVLKILIRKGKRKVLVVPIGFVSDNLETLYDLDIALKEKAKSLGILLQRAPSLNDSPKFIRALTDIVLKVLNG
jgi:ferrochelatase